MVTQTSGSVIRSDEINKTYHHGELTLKMGNNGLSSPIEVGELDQSEPSGITEEIVEELSNNTKPIYKSLESQIISNKKVNEHFNIIIQS